MNERVLLWYAVTLRNMPVIVDRHQLIDKENKGEIMLIVHIGAL